MNNKELIEKICQIPKNSFLNLVYLQMTNKSTLLYETTPIPQKHFFDDLSLITRINVRTQDRTYKITVTETIINSIGVTSDELFEAAMNNSVKRMPPVIRTVEEVFGIKNENPEFTIYSATTENLLGSAVIMAYPDFLENTAHLVDGSYFIIPASIHDILIIPDIPEIKEEDINQIIPIVNDECTYVKERLGTHAYYYDASKKQLKTKKND